MASLSSNSANLSLTVTQVVAFLTHPLNDRIISQIALGKLQLALKANLKALYAPTWRVENPLHKSGSRRLIITPSTLPPQPIYDVCVTAGLQWYEWMAALGNVAFDLYADPGCVTVCYHTHNPEKGIIAGKHITVWLDTPIPSVKLFAPTPKAVSKTFAQEILEDDHEEADQLFRLIARETHIPPTPIHVHFPSARSLSPLSSVSDLSRSSSRSSNSSSTFSSNASSTTSISSTTSYGMPTSALTAPELSKPKQSRREKARQARVFVDRSKNDVTPYDGGKTTVLTGGVMLGGARYAAPKPSSGAATSWRSV